MNFWDNHTTIFILAMMAFPRLTMLLGTTYGGGFLYWVGWLIAPRFTVAIIATILYHEHNPTLLVFTWLWALIGETSEKVTITAKALE